MVVKKGPSLSNLRKLTTYKDFKSSYMKNRAEFISKMQFWLAVIDI